MIETTRRRMTLKAMHEAFMLDSWLCGDTRKADFDELVRRGYATVRKDATGCNRYPPTERGRRLWERYLGDDEEDE